MRRYGSALCVTLLAVVAAACGSQDNAADSAKSGGEEVAAASQQSPPRNYDGKRAEKLCEKYNSGMLTEENYAEIIDLVDIAYTRLWEVQDSLIEASADAEAFHSGSMMARMEWERSFPFAGFLANAYGEAPAEQRGAANDKRWEELTRRMQKSLDDVERHRKAKFGDY